MNEAEQALAYANADFETPHNDFIQHFVTNFRHTNINGQVLDLGCGPADISIRFALTFPYCKIEGVDGAKNMLKHGRKEVTRQKLNQRIDLICGYLPKASLPRKYYDTIISNSLLHHLTDPMIMWDMINKYATPNSHIFVMDLMRPDSIQRAYDLVDQYAANEPAILKEDFFNSLCASYTADEVRDQLAQANLSSLKFEIISDRHFIVHGYTA